MIFGMNKHRGALRQHCAARNWLADAAWETIFQRGQGDTERSGGYLVVLANIDLQNRI